MNRKYKITMVYLTGHLKNIVLSHYTDIEFGLKTYSGVTGKYKVVKVELNNKGERKWNVNSN